MIRETLVKQHYVMEKGTGVNPEFQRRGVQLYSIDQTFGSNSRRKVMKSTWDVKMITCNLDLHACFLHGFPFQFQDIPCIYAF